MLVLLFVLNWFIKSTESTFDCFKELSIVLLKLSPKLVKLLIGGKSTLDLLLSSVTVPIGGNVESPNISFSLFMLSFLYYYKYNNLIKKNQGTIKIILQND